MAIACFAVTLTTVGARAEMLISREEAALPSVSAAGITFRSVTRGPKIQVATPTDGAVQSPVALHLKFESYGGATVDPASVKLTYMKKPTIDLTPRVKAFVRPDGLDMDKAELPPGDHVIKVDITDSQGRTGSTSFTLKVAP